MTDERRLALRLPGELHKKVKAKAIAERRSFNQQVVVILERATEGAATTGAEVGANTPAVVSDETALADGPINPRG